MSVSLANISATTTGVGGILMAIPQLSGLINSGTPANTIGYQPQTSLNTGTQTNAPALIFHYEGEQTVTLESDITDHFVENNFTVQDQIAIKPTIITTQGFIGELTDAPPNSVLAALQVAANKVTLVSGLAPSLTQSALDAYNQATFAYETAQSLASSAYSAFSSISNSSTSGEAVVSSTGISNTSSLSSFGLQSQGKQQIYFQQFYQYYIQRVLFTVQTPWAVFQNMAIKTLRAVQDAETNMITTFEVTFKQLRFAATAATTTNSNVTAAQGTRTYYENAPNLTQATTNLSVTVPQPVPPNTAPLPVGGG